VKVGILAGGFGTRLAEVTETKPKALAEIGGKPIIWHIMKHYCHFGFNEFVIAVGYRGDAIRGYFEETHSIYSCSEVGQADGVYVAPDRREGWMVEIVDTGNSTATGGRIKRLAPHLNSGTFMLTWCDGLSNIDLRRLLEFHRSHGRLATVTAVRPPPRFGQLQLKGDMVVRFSEKPPSEEVWINGAFFVLEAGVFDYIRGDDTAWEKEPLERLAKDRQLVAYRHEDFWQCMDTVSDQRFLQRLWDEGVPPWKVWE
jgi:glucose-1-phosphate cytidylyltransferase